MEKVDGPPEGDEDRIVHLLDEDYNMLERRGAKG
jgi:hypothetical protein